MSSGDPLQQFKDTCIRVRDAAQSAGLTLEKQKATHELVISRNGKAVTFPIVTDDRDWKETTPEEALYAVVLDTNAWASAHTDSATFATLEVDPTEKSEIPLINTDRSAELARLRSLVQVIGGADALKKLWAAAGFDGTALAGAGIS